MSESGVHVSIDELIERIPEGARVAVPKDSAGAPMAAARALIRRGTRRLHLITVPTSGLTTELLVGAGAVATVETSGVSLGEFGGAPRFNAAVKQGAVAVRDATCPAIYAALQAAEKGIPFIPLRGVIGSDVLAYRDDWKIIDNPFALDGEDPLLVLPAIQPEFALFHARRADRNGNVWIGVQGELAIMARAAANTLVTVEEVVDYDLLAEEASAAGTIPAIYVSAIAPARNGAWPLAFLDVYPADDAHLNEYVRLARTADGFDEYLRQHVEPAHNR